MAVDEDEDEVDEVPLTEVPRAQSPALSDTSSLTSLSSAQTVEKEPTPPVRKLKKSTMKKSAKASDYGSNFFNFYVDGGDDDDGDEEATEDGSPAAPAVKSAAKGKAKASASTTSTGSRRTSVASLTPAVQAPQTDDTPPADIIPNLPQLPRASQDNIFRNHTGPPPPYPTSAREKPPPRPTLPPLQNPSIELIDNVSRPTQLRSDVTVGEMINRVHQVCFALARYTGLPPPGSPGPRPAQLAMPTPLPSSTTTPTPATGPVPTASASPTPPVAPSAAFQVAQSLLQRQVTPAKAGSSKPTARSKPGRPTKASKDAEILLGAFDDSDNDSDKTIDEDEAVTSTAMALDPTPPAQTAPPVHPNRSAPTQPTQQAPRVPPPAPPHFARPLPYPGQPDESLIFGVAFIQNALKSFAHSRLLNEHAQYYWQEHRNARIRLSRQEKRGPGRPRKFDEEDINLHLIPTAHAAMTLAPGPEADLIRAFQDVLDCGALRINVPLPIELARAIRTMYKQIGNVVATTDPKVEQAEWRCLSYGPQIEGHRMMVERRKVENERALAELQRQQVLQQQLMMQRMHLGGSHGNNAGEQQYLSPYAQNPIPLASQPAAHYSIGSTPRPSNRVQAASPRTVPTNNHIPHGTLDTTSGPRLPSSPASNQVDKLNLLNRSGQSMNFSFPPKNETAVQVFGAQAFPSNEEQSHLPNRGPMKADSTPHKHRRPSEHIAIQPKVNSPQQDQQDLPPQQSPDTIRVASRPTSSRSAQAGRAVTNGAGSDIEMVDARPVHPSHRTQANVSAARARARTLTNGTSGATDAGRFPHPGAVVVNQ